MDPAVRLFLLALVFKSSESLGDELVKNGGFESMDHWGCWQIQCSLTTDKHSGHHALKVTGRHNWYEGPSQFIELTPGHLYTASGWVKLLSDQPGQPGQDVFLEIGYTYTDGSQYFFVAGSHNGVKTSDGWVHLTGNFDVPKKPTKEVRIYYQGPDPSVSFVVDDVSLKEISPVSNWRHISDSVINQTRKSDIHIHVTTASHVKRADVEIHVLQKKRSFPLGTDVSYTAYNSNAAGGKFRAFLQRHFNWATPGLPLKWHFTEQRRGQVNYQDALTTIHGLRKQGLKVRGHNLVWSVKDYVQDWLQQLSGNELRTVVKQHIIDIMNVTHGLLEHWDVNNENLHGTWYQDTLHDPDYDLELFRIAHHADPNVKLFLNEYGVVAGGHSTNDYLKQAQHFKAANVGLYGLGVQCHFPSEYAPEPSLIKKRLDVLAQAGLPIWVTELDVQAQDENRRADFYETALRAVYGHPAVEGIVFWGFWDQAHWLGRKASLVQGDDMQMNAAGRRVFDLFENQWTTDETHSLPTSGQLTVRGFHGDYEIRVMHQGRELANLNKTFTLAKGDHSVNINVHQ
ncbi:uncharacterized protein [Littorina saxatilis]|uniref:GH10 domain-containing protein n=1 Tax=Littorina saxatilis TaxID=31220 RepID=A0AAN9GES8_9CAEN